MDQHMDAVPKTDVIVVLGAAVWPGGKPSQAMRRRVRHAVELFRMGRADALIVTGGVGRHPPSEAEVMSGLAQAQGVPEERIIREDTAASTLQSAAVCAGILREKGWTTALIVSDPYHILRSVFLFRRFGVRAVGSATRVGPAELGRSKFAFWHVREFLALLWSAVRVYAWKRRYPPGTP